MECMEHACICGAIKMSTEPNRAGFVVCQDCNKATPVTPKAHIAVCRRKIGQAAAQAELTPAA